VQPGHGQVYAVSGAAGGDAVSRRRALLVLAAGTSGIAGCSGGGGGAGGGGGPCAAEPASPGAGAAYCLVEPRVVRAAGGRRLGIGEAVLTNVDDSTAIIVARDAAGFHALSAVCTHACCLVSLCRDPECASPTTNPGDCGTSGVATPDPLGLAILCPCHGSGFHIADGTPLKGPATRPLPSFSLSFDGDDVLVDTSRPVDASVRI